MEVPIFFICFIYALFTCTVATDTMVVNQTITDDQTIVSADQSFELGFFSPSTTTQNRYLGIWYKRLATGTVAWVANRNTPIANKTGELTLQPDGLLVLRDTATDTIIWSSNKTASVQNPVARLTDAGNFMVVGDETHDPEDYIWQSFDHPGNTFLPGLKFGRNVQKGVLTNFTSWKADDDPADGEYSAYMDFHGLPQIFLNKGDAVHLRIGSWNGLSFTGTPTLKRNTIFTFEFVANVGRETYYKFELINKSNLIKMELTPSGDLVRLNWVSSNQQWSIYSTPDTDNCAQYELCGVYGSCNIDQFPACGCLKGFIPKNQQQWDAGDWTSGCQREIPLDCGQDQFRRYPSMKLPDSRTSWFDFNMTMEQCQEKCRSECNCTAYSPLDIRVNSGCVLWYDELMDLRSYPNIGQDIFVRVAAAELAKDNNTSKSRRKVRLIVIPIMTVLTILLGVCLLMIVRRRRSLSRGRSGPTPNERQESQRYESESNDIDLPLFSLSTLLDATDNFSIKNKLGEGGFGPVYKGYLENGKEIAVKRLAKSSTQGVDEFKNEVIFISKLQHRNLVKILGCCIQGEERMLVYEYMPNKGLDSFIFQEAKKKTLNWTQRFDIINGVARGLLYLHQDSRLRIIHRDLKAGNILLDDEMNPKISDFGMARSFGGGNDTETTTKRVVGTYGYMSPEYAGDGVFSVKSDVFSFGVLMLEIVTGKKNRGFLHLTHHHNLLGHSWRLHKEGKASELVDASLVESAGYTFEMLRSIHVGLLCVQNNPDDRPNMSTVVMMLSSDGQLPEPNQPGFYIEDSKFGPESSSSMQTNDSSTSVSILLPR